MPEITDPQVIKFSNEKVRILGDHLYGLYLGLVDFETEYVAKDIGTLITNAGPSNLIADGSETDGRTRITGGDIFLLKILSDDLKFFLEQQVTATPSDGTRLALMGKIEVNGG